MCPRTNGIQNDLSTEHMCVPDLFAPFHHFALNMALVEHQPRSSAIFLDGIFMMLNHPLCTMKKLLLTEQAHECAPFRLAYCMGNADKRCLCDGQALLQAKWPPELEDNPSFCTKVYGEDHQLVPGQLATVRSLQLLLQTNKIQL